MEESVKAKSVYIPEPEVLPEPDMPNPPDGKAWKRKSDGVVYTGAVYLGMLFFKDGKRLKNPVKEIPEDFELVDLTEE
jgi:hypothetical protein